MFKRFLAIVLAIVMIAGVNIGPAYAAEFSGYTEEELQDNVSRVMQFIESHPTAQIGSIHPDDLHAIEKLTYKIVGDESDSVKQLELIRRWFAKYPNIDSRTIDAINKELGREIVSLWNCHEHAMLFQGMCRTLRIPCVLTGGAVRYYDGSGGAHQWAVVSVDDVWYFCDPTTFNISQRNMIFMRDIEYATGVDGYSEYFWISVTPSATASTEMRAWNISDYAVDGILEAYYKGLTYDYYFNRVDHKSPISRAEFAGCGNNLICQIEDVLWADIWDQYSSQGVDFEDTNDPDVKLANALGFVSGVGNNKFNPTGKITRQEAATMLMRIGQKYGLEPTADPVAFSDVAVDSWAKEGIDYVSSLGIMSGIGNNKFDPNGLYTYEQTILTVLRLYNAICE